MAVQAQPGAYKRQYADFVAPRYATPLSPHDSSAVDELFHDFVTRCLALMPDAAVTAKNPYDFSSHAGKFVRKMLAAKHLLKDALEALSSDKVPRT